MRSNIRNKYVGNETDRYGEKMWDTVNIEFVKCHAGFVTSTVKTQLKL